MARTADPLVQAIRRDAFVDAAASLIQAKGYEQTSIQDVLDATGASRGAFYHYFDSKDALLEAVVDRMAAGAMTLVDPIIDDPDLVALDKLARVFGGIAAFKAERRDLVLAVLDVWMSSDNAIVRERLRRRQAGYLRAVLGRIVDQGIAEGVFVTGSPDRVGMVLVSLMQGAGEAAVELFVGRQGGTVEYDEVRHAFEAYREAFERILGAPAGSVSILDDATLHQWFE
jgi:AcrR family transcriptional regulator